jgi:hypothetical protein
LYGIQRRSHCNTSQYLYLPVHCICSVTLSNHTRVLSGCRCIHTLGYVHTELNLIRGKAIATTNNFSYVRHIPWGE